MSAFACRRCGNCCRVEGYVRLEPGEADAAARFLRLPVHAFTARYTRLTATRDALSLTEQPGGACVFLGADRLCAIEPVKPRQCRDFPQRWRFHDATDICEGLK